MTSSLSVCAHVHTTRRHVWRVAEGVNALPSDARVVGVVLSRTCRGRCLDSVTDDATHVAVMDQVSHWLQ